MNDEQEIEKVLINIGETFSKLDIAAWLANFHNPRIIVLPETCYSPTSADECSDVMGPYFENLKDRGFNLSTLDLCNIKLLTETTAVASTVWTRYAGDKVLENFGATYLFQKTENVWGSIMVTVHSPDTILVC